MAKSELQNTLDLYVDKIRGSVFDLKKEKEAFFSVVESKKIPYSMLIEEIESKWNNFEEKNKKRVLNKTFTTFLYFNFDAFFRTFIREFFSLNEEALELNIKEKISDITLLLEYSYALSEEEKKIFDKISDSLGANMNSVLLFTGYVFFVVNTFGIIVHNTMNQDILITLDCATTGNDSTNTKLKFMILVRKKNTPFLDNYFKMNLYYFLKAFKGVPEEFFESLLEHRDTLYEVACKDYPHTQEKLIDLLYFFYKKCKLLGNFCPILDFLNFVCSRVEDSTFSKLDIIKKDFLANFEYTQEKKSAIIKIFNYLDNKSTLYSTLQANNLPSPRAQFNLFLLLMRYYFSTGLELLEVEEGLFLLPDKFKQKLNEYNKRGKVIDSKSIKNIGKFTSFLSFLSDTRDIDLIFNKIFDKKLTSINYRYFRTFLKSYNHRLSQLIENQNKILKENPKNELLTFNIVVDHICRILYVLIYKIFIKSSPDKASENFIDPRSRYVGKNIALRVSELFLFQEINFSDDIWPEFLISLHKGWVKKALDPHFTIPEKHFYSDYDLTRFLTIYNLQPFDQEQFLEEWMLNSIIIPINDFILKIKNAVKDPSNNLEVYEELRNVLLEDLENGDQIDSIKKSAQKLAPFWSDFE